MTRESEALAKRPRQLQKAVPCLIAKVTANAQVMVELSAE
jgi:hypothetical protein